MGATSHRTLWPWSTHLEFLRAQSVHWKLHCIFLAGCSPPSSWVLGAYCSGNSWNIIKEYLFIQGAFQGHRKTFEVTPFLFNNYVWVFSRILKRLKPLLTALSSVFWCSFQITPSTSNQIASQEKISLGMKLGSWTVSFYIVIWKNHFSAAGTVPLKVVKVIIYLAPAGQGMLLSHTHSLIVFTALSSTIFSDLEPAV